MGKGIQWLLCVYKRESDADRRGRAGDLTDQTFTYGLLVFSTTPLARGSKIVKRGMNNPVFLAQ